MGNVKKAKKMLVRNTLALIDAADSGQLDIVQALIPVSDPKAENSEALRLAALGGHLDVVRALIPVSDPKADHSVALASATASGSLAVVRELIPVCDPKDHGSAALRQAAECGHLDIVRELIPVSDLGYGDDAVEAAASNGHADVVRALLPVCNPETDYVLVLVAAVFNGHDDIVKLLTTVCDRDTSGNRALRWVAAGGSSAAVAAFVKVSNPSKLFQQTVGSVEELELDTARQESLRVLDALTPHVDENDLADAVRRLPHDLFTQVPHLVSWHQHRLLKTSMPSSTESCSGRRRL